MQAQDRFRGSMIGLAVGDALGTTVEFLEPGEFEPVTDIVGGGPFGMKPGQWTDDTSMACCLAESLCRTGGFNAQDQMNRYLNWRDYGYWSATGALVDIGFTTNQALEKYLATGNPFSGGCNERDAGNGSLMRLASVPLFYASDYAAAIHYSGESSRTTHALRVCVDCCRYYGGLIAAAANGVDKETLLSTRYNPAKGTWKPRELHPEVNAVAAGSFKKKSPPGISGAGFVVKSMEAALWAFHSMNDFESGALAAVNLGGDADTVTAIYGMLAGALYGLEGIPKHWVKKITMKDEIIALADCMYHYGHEKH